MEEQKKINYRRVAVLLSIGLILIGGIMLYLHNRNISHQKDLIARQQADFAKTATADPILKYLPYGTLDYNISPVFQAINGKRMLVLKISVLLTDADYRSGRALIETKIKQSEQAALNYIRSGGFDPQKYHIEYVVPQY